ncbi:MAG: membrane protein insertase YidC [Spirochaetes bacterium]|nr:membrane protein insertase YidC [Spirochaetota bacterium]MBU0954459.1 membrane protein insertase YidC [Spirochaetota bacterium]
MSDFYEPPKAFDKRTILAVVLSIAVITAVMVIQYFFFPPQPLPVEVPAQTSAPLDATTLEAPALTTAPAAVPDSSAALAILDESAPIVEAFYTIKTDLFTARFTNKGGDLVSLRLNEHQDHEGPVEMFLSNPADPRTFTLAFGDAGTLPVDALMKVSQPDARTIEFSRVLAGYSASGELVPFTLRKRYQFAEGEYMFKLSVTMESSRPEILRTAGGPLAYTLQIGPQIGPEYRHLPKSRQGSDWRKIITYEENKRKVINTKNKVLEHDKTGAWAAMTGKYFALVAIPDSSTFNKTFINTTVDGFPGETAMSFTRPALAASAQTDVYHFYAGPKSSRELARYDNAMKNSFGRSGDQLEAIMEVVPILSWLETLLKWGLNFFHSLVPNYGVAIILLTILVRLVLFPLTFKGSKSTAKMQEMQPLINEIREKYKNNPQRMNKEMAEFYQKNGSPLAGCLPQLLQLPIFIAMYSLFNNHFDLRGAMFIPGWIEDLSMPDAIISFSQINLIFTQVNALRGLPIIYLASQLLFGVFMQSPATAPGQSKTQMNIMLYGMPIFLFFMLYNVPSGLLVYWIASNVLAIGQQIIIKRITHKHHDEIIAENKPGLKLASGKNGKGNPNRKIK